MSDEIKDQRLESEQPETAADKAENEHESKKNKDKDHHKHQQEIDHLKKEIEKLQKENEELVHKKTVAEDDYRRKVAEFDNHKKRTLREMDDFRDSANKNLILDLLPIFDNFNRALNASENDKSFDNLYQGLKITNSQTSDLLSKLKVTAIDCVGKEFNHDLHQALLMEEREDVEFDTTVIQELERGYMLGDKVLKHAKVKVAKKKK